MTKQDLLTDYYTARWRYHTATKGTKRGWYRRLLQATKACMNAGVNVA